MTVCKQDRRTVLGKAGCAAGLLLALLAGCDSDTTTRTKETEATPTPVVAAKQWTLTGVFRFPAQERASNLKLVATTDQLSHTANSLASKAVPLVMTGTPPVATFSLAIDSRLPTNDSAPHAIKLVVFQDDNGNDVNDAFEKSRAVIGTTGCTVWCGDLPQCDYHATFISIRSKTWGTGSKGEYVIDNPGWYYQQGCLDYSCAKLIESGALFAGAVLAYSYYNDAPILTGE